LNRGLLVMHYGTPANLEMVLPYYTHIRRGRPPTQEALDDLVNRYKAIGGPSPLTKISRAQAELIHKGVEEGGVEATLYVGTKHAPPFVGDAVRQMCADGVEKAVGVVLAPHYSTFSIKSYLEYAEAALAQAGVAMDLQFVERWGTLPELIQAQVARVRSALGSWDMSETLVIFTAHSLPARILEEGDPYKDELLKTAGLIADRLQLPHWTFAFQSASSTGEPWLGPDILETLDQTAKAGRFQQVVACTVGFVSDHLEVLFDLGIEARDKCMEVGLELRVAQCINDDPAVMSGLARLVTRLFARS